MNLRNTVKFAISIQTLSKWKWLESILWTFCVLAIFFVMHPENPLFIQSNFPWPWLLSLIIILHYHFLAGLLSAIIITAATFYGVQQQLYEVSDIYGYLLGGYTLVLLVSMFNSSNLFHRINTDELLNYTQERLDVLSRSYSMLRLSYEVLEQNTITKPHTLRLALKELQEHVCANKGELNHDIIMFFLSLLMQFGSIKQIAFYLNEHGKLNPKPFAQIALDEPIILDDPLIKKALEVNKICFLNTEGIAHFNLSEYMIAIPLATGTHESLGLIVVKDIVFWGMNEDTIRIINILVAYFVNNIILSARKSTLLNKFPSCPTDFAVQLETLLHLKKSIFLDSGLVAILVPDHLSPFNIITTIYNHRRALDSYWHLRTESQEILIALIPFSGPAAIEGYIARIHNIISNTFGETFEYQQIPIRSMQLTKGKPEDVISQFLNFIGAIDHVAAS